MPAAPPRSGSRCRGGPRCPRPAGPGRRARPASGVGDGRDRGVVGLGHAARRLGRGVRRARSTTPGSSGLQERAALGGGHRDRHDRADVAQRGARRTASRCSWTTGITTSRWMSRSTSNASVSIGDVDRALDRVLDGHEADVDRAVGGGAQHVGACCRTAPARPPDRSGWVSSACSVKVPRDRGSRRGDRSRLREGMRRQQSRRVRIVTWTRRTLRQLLDDVRSGALHPDDAVARLRHLPFADLGFARVDHHRALRQGMPEAVYGPGKTSEHCGGHRGRAAGERVHRAGRPVAGRNRRPGTPRSTPTRGAPSTAIPPRGRHGGLAAGRDAARVRRGRWWSPPAPPTCPWPTSAVAVLGAHGIRRRALHRRRGRRPAPPARPCRRPRLHPTP